MSQPVELQGELETFFDSLISSLPGPPAGTRERTDMKGKLSGLCKLEGPDDTDRVKAALQHTSQVAEAMEIMTDSAASGDAVIIR